MSTTNTSPEAESGGDSDSEKRGDGGQTPVDSSEGSPVNPGGTASQTGTDGGIQELFQRDTTQEILKYHVSVFAVIGLGLLLVGALAPDIGQIFGLTDMAESAPGGTQMSGSLDMISGVASEAIIGIFMLFFMFVCGPIVAAVLGIVSGLRSDAADDELLLGSAVGSFAGYFVLFLIVLFVGGTGMPISPDLGGVITNGIPLSIPAGLVAAGTAYTTVNI